MIKSKRVNSVFLFISFLLLSIPIRILATDTPPKVLDEDYIYLDLYYGNITLSSTGYSGYVLENGVATAKSGDIDRGVYIYQSNGENTVWKNGLPSYDRVGAPADSGAENWGEYITDNTNVTGIITNWKTEAAEVNKAGTPYRISISGGKTYDVTLDNIWSNYYDNNSSRTNGGLSFYPNTSTTSKLTVNFKGDNRFGNIFYATGNQTKHKMILNGESDATLTVANISTSVSANHYNSAIGGSDSAGYDTVGLYIENGIIFAGTTYADNCTAIGAGGNAKGDITINGGTITAVSNSTGVAIGGGIGYSSQGGDAVVRINGGNIYAYNFGYEGIPAAAIGGGSSKSSDGNKNTTVTIEGGNIYAESVGGTAIGGGSSKTKNGGPATVNIGGNAKVIAKSVVGTYKTEKINAGAAIGGGTGGTNSGVNGGNATVKIYGNAEVYTGSIGGGKTNNSTGKIGNANVVITENPVIQGQFIMAAGSNSPCSFTMTGGTIDNSSKTEEFTFLQKNGGAVYIENGDAIMNGGQITGCMIAENGGAVYVAGGDFTMTKGSITNNIASNEGGAIYVDSGDIIIGLEACLGLDETHSHPIIENNTAENNGGGLAVNGGTITMYCGNLSANKSIQNQSSNSVSQSSGIFEIHGGDLGIGIFITGGSFDDTRDGTYQVKYHAVYGDVSESVLINVESNEKITLPNENSDILNENFSRTGLWIVGWSTTPDSDEGYMFVGDVISVPQNTDLYAVWGDEEPIPSYIVYIPDELEIDHSETGSMTIDATIKYFTNIAKLNVIISKIGDLVLEDDEDIYLEYELINENTGKVLKNGDTLTFTREGLDEIELTAELIDETKYSGIYTDIISFEVEYDSGI